jgi:hypothetical protein
MYRDEVDLQDRIGREQRVPDVGLAGVFRPAEYANVNTMPIVRQLSVPFDARVRAEERRAHCGLSMPTAQHGRV